LPSTPSSTPPDDSPGRSRRARWILAGIAIVVVLAVGVVTWAVVAGNDDTGSADTVSPVSVRNGGPRAGDVAPDFTLGTLDGKAVSLSDYRGKPVVLNFWASWCNPCRREFPLLRAKLASATDHFVVLGVDNRDIDSDARSFAKDQHATWPIAVDHDQKVWKAYAAQQLPQTFFIRPDGTIAERIYGQLTEHDFDAALAKITSAKRG
jgi:peroxiredoxin